MNPNDKLYKESEEVYFREYNNDQWKHDDLVRMWRYHTQKPTANPSLHELITYLVLKKLGRIG